MRNQETIQQQKEDKLPQIGPDESITWKRFRMELPSISDSDIADGGNPLEETNTEREKKNEKK